MALLQDNFPIRLTDLENTFGSRGSLRGYLATTGSPTVNVAGPRGFIPATSTDLRLSDFLTSAFADVPASHSTSAVYEGYTGGPNVSGQGSVTASLIFGNNGRCSAQVQPSGTVIPDLVSGGIQPIPDAWTLIGAGGPTMPSSIASNFLLDITKTSGSWPFSNVSNHNLGTSISITVIASAVAGPPDPSTGEDIQTLSASYAIKRADNGQVIVGGTVDITLTVRMFAAQQP